MNIYDVLRRLVSLAPMSEPEHNDAIAAIDQLQQWNALGTVARDINVITHESQTGYPFGMLAGPRCTVCGREPH